MPCEGSEALNPAILGSDATFVVADVVDGGILLFLGGLFLVLLLLVKVHDFSLAVEEFVVGWLSDETTMGPNL